MARWPPRFIAERRAVAIFRQLRRSVYVRKTPTRVEIAHPTLGDRRRDWTKSQKTALSKKDRLLLHDGHEHGQSNYHHN